MSTDVSVHTAGLVRTVTINVPHRRNALSGGVLAELRAAISTATDVSAIVLTGAGGVFSAGADLAELTGTSDDEGFDDEIADTVAAIRDAAVPVVAAIEGPCVGAAVDIALACDARVCDAGAWLQLPAVQLGLLYNPSALTRLHRALPRDTLARLVLLAERFTAHAAQRSGLVSTVVSYGHAVPHAQDLGAELHTAPRDALTHTKRLLAALDDGALDVDHWQRVRQTLLNSPARHEAVYAARQRTTARTEDKERTREYHR